MTLVASRRRRNTNVRALIPHRAARCLGAPNQPMAARGAPDLL